ncbi:hypothetical protein [Actibacterium ureilyticum]|uniref:hypothetical protein n=1 Tax=Actibacterium ureilyticum TaxID=1590614 RepID=UPI000BAB0350|nr:hypothetical protein [Actibacterium ureilyticum]
MGITLDLSQLSVVFISLDEPNADAHFEALKRIVPTASRVHGVRGFDAAHRQAAQVARTAHVLTVDADNMVTQPDFFAQRLRFTASNLARVISFSARLAHNGLQYGNGGIKIWPRTLMHGLRTHEASRDGRLGIDFAYRVPYVQAHGCPSASIVTATPQQAFRAGFREGVRLTLERGIAARDTNPELTPAERLKQHLPESVLERLRIWCTVGRDVENGAFAILGARLGCLRAMQPEFDLAQVADFDALARIWTDEGAPLANDRIGLEARLADLRAAVNATLDLAITELSPGASAFVKSVYRPKRRLGTILPD